MPFGLKNAPATFQRFMDRAFGDLKFVKIYIDDLIIASQNAEEHLGHITAVLDRCIAKGISLRRKKCQFLQRSLKVLGYYISSEGITQDPEKLEAIKNYGTPQNAKQLRSFLGLVQFFRMFSPKLADLLHPLYHLCSKKVKFLWTAKEQDAFRRAKEELITKRTLAFPDCDKRFFVSVDASDNAFGATLFQFQEAPDGKLLPHQILSFSDE
jgi:hypothetical protein